MSDIENDAEAKRVARNAYQLRWYHEHKRAVSERRKELGTARAYSREYYHENKEALQAKAKTEAGRESARLRTRRYREKDPERAAALAKQWAEENADKCRAKALKYYYASRERDPVGNWALRVFHASRTRARKTGLAFDLDRDHIRSLCVTHCPALGLELAYNARTPPPPNCASLDRIKPELGYVRGNVIVISYLANTIKQNATAFQVRAVGGWMLNMEGGE